MVWLLHAEVGPWQVGAVVSGVTAVTFLGIAFLLGHGLWRQRRFLTNPLAAGTFLIFLTCGGGHLLHTLQVVTGAAWLSGLPARVHYGEWHLWVADGLTAAAGTAYWVFRRRVAGLVEGAAIYEDLQAKRNRAAVMQDRVVQDMAKARMALRLGDSKAARGHVDRALDAVADLEDS